VLLVVGSLTDTYRADLTRRVLRVWGWAPADFAIGELYRIVTSALVTHGGATFWTALALVVAMVGAAEWRTGTRRVSVTFWGGHIVTLVVMASVAYLHTNIDPETAGLWSEVRDVGPSAGAFSCLGLLAAGITGPGRWRLTVGVMALLVTDALLVPGSTIVEASADIAHLIAFPLGFVSTLIGKGR